MVIEKQQGSSSTYSTSDIYLSAFLKAKGMRLQDKRQIGNKCHFIFQDRQDRELLIQDFFNDGLVNITAFKNALQDLKALVFNI
jgi:hypothetical protein